MLKLLILVCFTVNVLVDSYPLDESAIEGRIIGGNDTDITQAPYQAALFVRGYFWCGGIILSPTYILTAGRCVMGSRDDVLIVQAGSTSVSYGPEMSVAKKIHRNPRFNENSRDYDVAVIELETPFRLDNKKTKAIALATKEPSSGSVVVASGWGYYNEKGELSETLQSISVPIVDRKTCETNYKAKNVTITPRMICAGAKGKVVQNGDHGGPVTYKNELVGIILFGGEYGKDMPGVYTNVADPEITKFIKDVTKL